ncbi:hypothetical protein IX317_001668 [Fusobacterium sp. DD29]|uniref:Panacea domain-containing protein n=1 Tax=unclassified Fusobacterium TaxID=2648384 RepID=UPI001B8DA4C4|nr:MULTISPECIES: type II toxin-antitoxin system antitoxin SocA domain-containing protein [unclassified Fusobacterium]MBR8701658.1 hypothetical protein [Fusobacterium sp. DD45]MBR8711439.1 hypothetical protein [Fusobacterium sp. DD28]MBR8749988.1 hypothetical protein [Fusobacterium sp. DD29]MBR8751988.1 hypothetical protein [Fusobacterium sp. DD26]MBR8762199.1 hypothetical protein [Fusobacterium sp. DD25]
MYSIFCIANWFLSKEAMTPKKLQKLCYYAQAWNLALCNKRLINNDFQAWIHGPVCPDLYRRYKNYGWTLINQEDLSSCSEQLRAEDINLLESVWTTYGAYDGQQLESLTHSETPWINARAGLGMWEQSQNIISDEDMRSFYLSIYIGD